ncbi:TetR/AcrR family transcriptional regulator [Paraburkholderia youngii]|uniref:TetR/AcrR family transcriptional regulator n=1 Tax=Paraburkholderia youngii TaxID=2782701 RepID=A0ABX2NWF2_9BURK|nr:TetR/AcrR family transcriptional regulator [Paraburkholderia youngii]NVI08205.1 TetR/AcrR family transcriptional regulator [Paraburkholderia youngii]
MTEKRSPMPKNTSSSERARAVATRKTKAAEPVDHRVRTGAARSERTRRKLLAAAMAVFAERGADAAVIDDFIAAAGVARGTFYNYFNSTQELLDAVTVELSDAIVGSIENVVSQEPDPLKRLALGCLLYMHLGVDVPTWGDFLMRVGSRSKATGKLVNMYLPRDLQLAHKAGEVDYPTLRAAHDLVFASLNQGIQTVNSGEASRDHLRQVLLLALRGIGVTPALSARLSQMELPEVELPAGVFDDVSLARRHLAG